MACFEISQRHVFQTGLELTAGANGIERKPRFETVDVGQRSTFKPRISADRKFIELKFQYESATLAKLAPVMPIPVAGGINPETDLISRPDVDVHAIETVMMLPHESTAVIAGPVQQRDVTVEHALPMLAQLPYMNRLFRVRSQTKETRSQVILLTARVINEEPKESDSAKFVKEYKKACGEGRTEDAMRFAMKALAMDPKCFEK